MIKIIKLQVEFHHEKCVNASDENMMKIAYIAIASYEVINVLQNH